MDRTHAADPAGPDEELTVRWRRGWTWRSRIAVLVLALVVAGLIGWRITAAHHRQSVAANPSSGRRSTDAVATTTSPPHPSETSCPISHVCRSDEAAPSGALMAVRKVIPSAGFAPGSERSVTDATDRRLAYRELIVTGEGFELVITVSTAQSDQPADATFLVAGAYHVSFVCSGPPRQCPAIAALRRLAFDPRLVALL